MIRFIYHRRCDDRYLNDSIKKVKNRGITRQRPVYIEQCLKLTCEPGQPFLTAKAPITSTI